MGWICVSMNDDCLFGNQQTQQTVAGKQSSLEASREALSTATARERELRASQSGAAQDVETYAQRASALQAELAVAKKRVDVAQVPTRSSISIDSRTHETR